jgi:hypothetical protein
LEFLRPAELYSASVQGRGVLAERGREGVQRLGRRREARPLSLPGELCASLEGFSLHAKVALEADDHAGRERLARYLARPPIASERLSLAEDGRVLYRLRRHWKDGTRAVLFDPLDFIARLAALIPRPRNHSLTYHGVLAPAAEWRDWIVPGGPRSTQSESQCLAAQALRPTHAKTRASWAELLKRVFEIDVLRCPWCVKHYIRDSSTSGGPGHPRLASSCRPEAAGRASSSRGRTAALDRAAV